MNILLIGNGFDLEHNLPTSYKDFLEFCKRANRIFSFIDETPDEYKQNALDGWNIDYRIKNVLLNAFNERFEVINEVDVDFSTPNLLLNELYTLLHENTWLNYFLRCKSFLGENWIDFESEISRVIKVLEIKKIRITRGKLPTNIDPNEYQILVDIRKVSPKIFRDALEDTIAIDNFTAHLNRDLDKLIRALEIYISEFINNINIPNKDSDIEKLTPDHVLSFNYSNTYQRIYGKDKNITYCYLHGKAEANNTVETCKLVLGIDDYLDDDRKDSDLDFLAFKKYYQRIYKSTDNKYLNWIETIQGDYSEYLRKLELARTSKPDPKLMVPYGEIYYDLSSINYEKHNLYIFGHSLDITDKDVLKPLICNDNVQTTIYYHTTSPDDKKTLGKLIKNLVKIIGKDELIKRTGGSSKTIVFIPQNPFR